MLRLRRLASRRTWATILALSIAALAGFIFLTGQGGPPQPIPLFGVDSATLARDYGVLVYPPEGSPAINASQAELAAREGQRQDPVAEVQLVHLKLPYEGFDGLAWAVNWDVAGGEAVLPGPPEAAEEPFVYLFDITFIDARTGKWLTRIATSQPLTSASTHD
jgi:hypothetical protein